LLRLVDRLPEQLRTTASARSTANASGNASRARTRLSPRTWQQRFIQTETLVRHAQEADRVERWLEGLVVERNREARREVAHRALTW
jgi:hypothetical protein